MNPVAKVLRRLLNIASANPLKSPVASALCSAPRKLSTSANDDSCVTSMTSAGLSSRTCRTADRNAAFCSSGHGEDRFVERRPGPEHVVERRDDGFVEHRQPLEQVRLIHERLRTLKLGLADVRVCRLQYSRRRQ